MDTTSWRGRSGSSVVGCMAALAGATVGCNLGGELADQPSSDDSAHIGLVRTREEAPAWTIRYGDEFWRRPATNAGHLTNTPDSHDIDLGDVIDRVSHAIERPNDGTFHRASATTFTASFDGR